MTEQTQYQDGDFVYVDPDKRVVIGKVEWVKEGVPKRIEWEVESSEPKKENSGAEKRKPRKKKKRYYPWGTYHTIKKLYKIEGREAQQKEERYIPLEDAIVKLMDEPFWD